MNHSICSCLMALFLMIPNLHAQRMIEVDTRHLGASIQPTMWGIFFEDINFGADGGLYAERLIGRQKESAPTNFVGKTIGQVWSTFGIFIGAIGLIFCLAGCGLLNLTFTVSGDYPDAHLYINLTSIISLCFGIASTITGFILKNRVVQICGFIAGLGGFFCALQYPWAEQLYVMAAVSVVGLIVPGFVIYFQNHQ